MKQYSDACDQNRDPILAIIGDVFRTAGHVLEIGSGTGQHAVYFARHLAHLQWQTSDLPSSHASIRAWIDEAGLDNVLPPLTLDVAASGWPADRLFAGVFSANTTHIMSWPMVESMFAGIGRVLQDGASLCLYGPFNYDSASMDPSIMATPTPVRATNASTPGCRTAIPPAAYAISRISTHWRMSAA